MQMQSTRQHCGCHCCHGMDRRHGVQAGSDAPSSMNQSSNSCFKTSLTKRDGYKLTQVKYDHQANTSAWQLATPLQRTVPLLTGGDVDKEEHLVA
jgi:hypothetical protein